MPFFKSGDDWLRESTLLVQARPSTTRVTTRYNHAKPENRISRRQKDKRAPAKTEESESDASDAAQLSSGVLTLKTYDPVSGVCLQYKTTKGQEVGRLVAALGRIGKCMSGAPDAADMAGSSTPAAAAPAVPAGAAAADGDDVAMEDAPADEAETEKAQAQGHSRQKKSVSFAEGPPQVQKLPPQQQQQQQNQGGGGGGGGGKKKKKGGKK